MACENDKCAKYGMHHDYENGIEVRKCQFCLRDEILIQLNEENHVMICTKCLTENPIMKSYAYCDANGMQKVDLCVLCNSAYDQNLLSEFLKEDFGICPVNKISKDMIDARRKRVLGQDPRKSATET